MEWIDRIIRLSTSHRWRAVRLLAAVPIAAIAAVAVIAVSWDGMRNER